jgi:hypothetical protein
MRPLLTPEEFRVVDDEGWIDPKRLRFLQTEMSLTVLCQDKI